MNIKIRKECAKDIQAIEALTKAAFHHHPHSLHNEHIIIQKLRKNKALSLSLVAILEDKLVGQISFSPITIATLNINWLGLGPISVDPLWQKNGIGKSLIQEGLVRIKKSGVQGCVVLGDPLYYKKFGFSHQEDIIFEQVPAEYFMALHFTNKKVSGIVKYHSSFY